MSFRRTSLGMCGRGEEKSYTSRFKPCIQIYKAYKISLSLPLSPPLLYRNDTFFYLKKCVQSIAFQERGITPTPNLKDKEYV